MVTKTKAVDSNLYGERPNYSGGMPEDRAAELGRALNWLNYHTDSNELLKHTYAYMEKNLSKAKYTAFKKAPQALINFTTQKLIYMASVGWELNEEEQAIIDRVVDKMVTRGKTIKDKVDNSKVVTLSPADRLRNKVRDTIIADLDELEEKWINGETAKIDVYTLMQKHELKGPVPSQMVAEWANTILDDIECTLNKEDDQCVEAYKHLTKKALTDRKKILEDIIAGAGSFAIAQKASRTPRKKKPKVATSQVSKVKYQNESNEHQLKSIDPANIPGAFRLFTFNTKNRELTEYVSTRREGFEVSGTSVKHFDPDLSRKTKLRKPEDFLTIALTKTPKQVDNEWKKLTTKSSKPTGRLNEDTILLRVLDK